MSDAVDYARFALPVFGPGTIPGYECDSCGACCRTFAIFASVVDAAREPRIREFGRELPASLGSEVYRYRLHPLPFLDGCCFVMEDNRCEVYDTRPNVCRDFAAGDAQCQMAREQHGMTPLLPAGVEGQAKLGIVPG